MGVWRYDFFFSLIEEIVFIEEKPKYELNAKQRSDFAETGKDSNCVVCLDNECNTMLLCCLVRAKLKK